MAQKRDEDGRQRQDAERGGAGAGQGSPAGGGEARGPFLGAGVEYTGEEGQAGDPEAAERAQRGEGRVKAGDIVFDKHPYDVRRAAKKGFEVYKYRGTHSVRVATIAYEGQRGLDRAKAEIERRLAEDAQERPRDLITEREREGQLGLPGTERVTSAQLAKRKANEPLRPRVAQEPPSGLFAHQGQQLSLEDFIDHVSDVKAQRPEALPMDKESRLARAKELGFDTDKVWYHGTRRADRLVEKGKLDPRRAQSGPMPYFTDDPEIASNYAKSKADTSLEAPSDYAGWFRFKPNGMRSTVDVSQAWHFLDLETRKTISERAPHINMDDDGKITYDPNQGFPAGDEKAWREYYLPREGRGNPLKTLVEVWLNSAHLFNDEEKFMDVLRLAGMKDVEFDHPYREQPGVLPVYMKVSHPLDTANTDELRGLLPELQALASRSRRQPKPGADPWAKSSNTPRTWLERFREDLKDGTTHAWTSIPDEITKFLADKGYDAVLDRGGKGGGPSHNVMIPFRPDQVRSVNAKFDAASADSDKLLAQRDEAKPSAPPFYSAVLRGVESAKQPKASPQQWLGMLKNMPGLKQEERDWLGLDDWLRQQKGSITKEQIADYVRANQIEVKEVERAGTPPTRDTTRPDEEASAKYGDEWRALVEKQDAIRSEHPHDYWDVPEFARNQGRMDVVHDMMVDDTWDRIQARGPIPKQAKFGQYTLPDGENYRELLLTLPQRSGDAMREAGLRLQEAERAEQQAMEQGIDVTRRGDITDATDQARAAFERERERQKESTFKSSHFDEPNILAHIRFDDRTVDGKKTLHVAEIQSDWHQKGKKHGYAGQPLEWSEHRIYDDGTRSWKAERNGYNYQVTKNLDGSFTAYAANVRVADDLKTLEEAKHEAEDYISTRGGGVVPNAPFKTTWPELALKRIIRYASENGYDRLSWDSGETQAARYDLSKQIRKLTLSKLRDGHFLQAIDHQGHEVINKAITDPEKELPDIIGKEAAEKLLAQELIGPKLLPRVEPDQVELTRGAHSWMAETKDGRRAEIEFWRFANADEAKEYVARMWNGQIGEINKRRGEAPKTRTLEGLDLKVGGEGMKGFYDQILPATVNKLVKKYGAKVERGNLEGAGVPENRNLRPGHRDIIIQHDEDGTISVRNTRTDEVYGDNLSYEEAGKLADRLRLKPVPVHTLDITPDIKDAALHQGFPLFKTPSGWETAEGRGEPQGEKVRIGRDTYAYVNPKYSAKEQEIANAVMEIGARMAPKANIKGVAALRQSGATIWGGFINNKAFPQLITWSLGKGDAGKIGQTVRHEVIHHLRNVGLFKPEEWKALETAAIHDGWLQRHRIYDRYGDLPAAQKVEEAIAEEFGKWRAERSLVKPGPIRDAFMRLDLFLRRVAAAARKAMGFNATPADIFTRIETGEVGRREPVKRASGGRVESGTGKRTRDSFGYMEPSPNIPDFAQCGSCQMWIKDRDRCHWFSDSKKVEANDSCTEYVQGESIRGNVKATNSLDPKEAGFIKGSTRCENCVSLDKAKHTCMLFEKLNRTQPTIFDLDEHVKPRGCCNAFSRDHARHEKIVHRASGGRIVAHSIDHNPTEAQKQAGNYRHGHITVHGLDVSIEGAKGSERSGIDKEGKPWRCVLPAAYGYIRGTTGADSDHVDVYVGPHRSSKKVFVVDQHDADTKRFDEHKALVCFASEKQARDTYHRGFSDGRGKERLGHLTEMGIEQFKGWLSGKTDEPLKGTSHAPKVDRTKDVKVMSELSRDGSIIYIDRSLPRTVLIAGKRLDPAEPLIRHEVAEYNAMRIATDGFIKEHGRRPNSSERHAIYLEAHKMKGTPAEREWMKTNGYSWDAWSAWVRGELSRLERKVAYKTPRDTDVRPFPHGSQELESGI